LRLEFAHPHRYSTYFRITQELTREGGAARLATALTISSLLAVQTASTQDAKPIIIRRHVGLRVDKPATDVRRQAGIMDPPS
jgi:hypothetical protein